MFFVVKELIERGSGKTKLVGKWNVKSNNWGAIDTDQRLRYSSSRKCVCHNLWSNGNFSFLSVSSVLT